MKLILVPAFIDENKLYIWAARKQDIKDIIYPVQNVGQIIFIDCYSDKENIDLLADKFVRETKINIYNYKGKINIILSYKDEDFVLYLLLINKNEEKGYFTYKDTKYDKAGWLNINDAYKLFQYDDNREYNMMYIYNTLYQNNDRYSYNKILNFIKKNYGNEHKTITDILNKVESDNAYNLIEKIIQKKCDNKFYIASILYLHNNQKKIIKKYKIINKKKSNLKDSW